jgi:hypothetical protein
VCIRVRTQPDGNTQVPAYLMGAIVAKKILKGQ